jgi:hypothetical protein
VTGVKVSAAVAAGRAADAVTLVFINYRGSDAALAAALLHAELANRFGVESVFLDYESIPPGKDFGQELLARVRSCVVLLAVVGDRWLAGEVGSRRIDSSDDWVRREIAEALARGVPVVPVVVGGAKLDAERLPEELAELAKFQYHEVRNRHSRQDIRGLCDYLVRHFPSLRDRPVPGLTLWQGVVATLQDGIHTAPGSGATVTLEVNETGVLDRVTLRRTIPSAIDRQLAHDPQLFGNMVRAAGLRDDTEAAQAVQDWTAKQLAGGHDRFDRAMVERAVAELGLRDAAPRAVLSVATLKPDPMAVRADHALDWVDRFEGGSDYGKRRPLAPATWTELQADIEAIPQHLRTDRSEVLVTGSLRQATAFTVGAALRMVTGRDVAVNQRGQLWASNTPFDAPLAPVVHEHRVEAGDDVAVAIIVATAATDDVTAFVEAEKVPVGRLVTMCPPTGIRDNAIPDAGTAVAFAYGCRDAVRAASRGHRRVHLFLAGPMGLALLLGHRWNNVRPTVVYEDVRGPFLYERAFTVDA